MLRQLAREGCRSFVFIKNAGNLSIISARVHVRARRHRNYSSRAAAC